MGTKEQPGHEEEPEYQKLPESTDLFKDVPAKHPIPFEGESWIDTTSRALGGKIREAFSDPHNELEGFKGRVVADVGARDGRFVPMLQKLGASEVYGIDPDKDELDKAVAEGLLDEEHALRMRLQDIPEDVRGKIDSAVVLNYFPEDKDRKEMAKALYDLLPDDGEIVVTMAERETIIPNARMLKNYFHLTHTEWTWGSPTAPNPHMYLLIGKKRKIAMEPEEVAHPG